MHKKPLVQTLNGPIDYPRAVSYALEGTMSRNQINVKLSDRQARLLEELAEQYGSISSAVRIALENLYERTFPERGGEVPMTTAGERGAEFEPENSRM